MDMSITQPPPATQLWRGALLGTIAHALWLVQHPEFAHEQSWDGPNYSVQNSSGSRGTVTFAETTIVGVLFDEESERNPFRSGAKYDRGRFFVDIPPEVFALAEAEALQYVVQEHQGRVMPVITTAFWSTDGTLTAAEPWRNVMEHGGRLLQLQLTNTEQAITAWQGEYTFSMQHVQVLRSLFERRIHTADAVLVEPDEHAILFADGTHGIEECRELLAGINIVLP